MTKKASKSAKKSRSPLAAALAITAAVLILTVLVGSSEFGRRSIFIYLMENGPDYKLREKAAHNLRDFPGKPTIEALVGFIKSRDYESQKDESVSALSSLCLLSNENFGSTFEGNRQNSSIGYPDKRDWPYIAANINDWAWEKGYRKSATEPVKHPEIDALLEQMASENEKQGIKAWKQLKERYTDADTYLNDLKRKFDDKRPIQFVIKRSMTDTGVTYGATDLQSNKEWRALASTVGQAIRYPLWMLDPDKQKELNQTTFRSWWNTYTRSKELSTASETWPSPDDPEV